MHQVPGSGYQFDTHEMEIVRHGRQVLGGAAAMFYWADDLLGITSDFVSDGISRDYVDSYVTTFEPFDPMHIRHLGPAGQTICRFRADPVDTSVAPYVGFLGRHGFADLVEFVFRSRGRLIAGLTILRSPDDPPFTAETLELAASLHRFCEFSLQGHPEVTRRARLAWLQRRALTDRELEIASLVCSGHSNETISSLLDLRLATVKSHVNRILSKTGQENRLALLRYLSAV